MSRAKRGERSFELCGLISVDKLIDVGIKERDIVKLKEAGVYECNYLKSFDPKSSALVKFFTTDEVVRIRKASDKLMNRIAAERVEIDEGSSDECELKKVTAASASAGKSRKRMKFAKKLNKLDAERVATDEGSSDECELKKLTAASGSAGKSRKRMKSAKKLDGSVEDFLYVSGLPSDVSRAQLEDFFRSCGSLEECDIIKFDNGKCKGFAYLKFKSPAAMAEALSHNGNTIGSNIISVVLGTEGMRQVGGCLKRDVSGGKGSAKN